MASNIELTYSVDCTESTFDLARFYLQETFSRFSKYSAVGWWTGWKGFLTLLRKQANDVIDHEESVVVAGSAIELIRPRFSETMLNGLEQGLAMLIDIERTKLDQLMARQRERFRDDSNSNDPPCSEALLRVLDVSS